MPDHLCHGGTRQAPPLVATAALFNLFVPKLFMSLMIQDVVLTCTSETSSYHDIFSLFNLKPIIRVVLAKPCMRNPPVSLLLFDANSWVKPSPAYDIPVAVNPYNCKTHLWEPSCPSNPFSYYFFQRLFQLYCWQTKWCPLCRVWTSHHTVRTRVMSKI